MYSTTPISNRHHLLTYPKTCDSKVEILNIRHGKRHAQSRVILTYLLFPFRHIAGFICPVLPFLCSSLSMYLFAYEISPLHCHQYMPPQQNFSKLDKLQVSWYFGGQCQWSAEDEYRSQKAGHHSAHPQVYLPCNMTASFHGSHIGWMCLDHQILLLKFGMLVELQDLHLWYLAPRHWDFSPQAGKARPWSKIHLYIFSSQIEIDTNVLDIYIIISWSLFMILIRAA